MYSTFHLNSPTEITSDFIEAIKLAFKNKAIVITVTEEIDTTDYLKSSSKNKAILDASILQDAKGEYIAIKNKDL